MKKALENLISAIPVVAGVSAGIYLMESTQTPEHLFNHEYLLASQEPSRTLFAIKYLHALLLRSGADLIGVYFGSVAGTIGSYYLSHIVKKPKAN